MIIQPTSHSSEQYGQSMLRQGLCGSVGKIKVRWPGLTCPFLANPQ